VILHHNYPSDHFSENNYSETPNIMPKTIIITVFFVLSLGAANAFSAGEPAYHYKDSPFKQVVYDKDFFAEVFLDREISNIEKFRKNRSTIIDLFNGSNVAAFDLVDFDKLDTVGRTVIIVFDASNEDALPEFLLRFVGIKPFASYFDKQSSCGAASYTQVGKNGEKILVVRIEPKGKDLAYVLNFLAKVQKTAGYKNRANCFKPSN